MLLKWQIQRLLHQTQHSLASPSRNPRATVVIGRLLGIAFLICFATGTYSHFIQEPLPGMVFLTRPIWLYQVSQGIHITAGIICFPLLFAKLYTVFPGLFQSPPVRSFPHFLERASIALFVASSLVQITIGLLNTYQWYALFPFAFRQTHYALSFVIIGSLAIHIAVKLPIISRYWLKRDAVTADGEIAGHEVVDDPAAPDELQRLTGKRQYAGVTGRIFQWIDSSPAPRPQTSRRGFFATVAVASAALVTLTAGQSFRVFDATNLFGARKNDVGPQGLPVNRTAKRAKVLETATSADWRLTVSNGESTKVFSYDDLRAMTQYEVVLPIACVEGWSQYATWQGPRLKDLIAAVGAEPSSTVRLTSLEQDSSYAQTTMQPEFVRDDLTLIALDLEGEPLDIDHGYPARAIAPARPGVLQTKWLSTLEVMS
ncbi:molybdopterin-binding protein [Salinibacterium xinjiangense]|uniref:Oxidoreductase molybdopterin binding domain-containing protein n=1 Tax=Salinibacterium xinjiangense TaxID=386302 RepID=A0A2C8Y9A1_9MICO|nr:molybdopterin-dependent oxidoreductase [Salinibacterium xinjiangense]GGK95974.1 molybdopterin-binding protein [Salinibacterium xinjiangense]SOE46784.1 Oxidoreductase molybdopterin binding domain-containing protein [Salinibacterium xinjiangense]